MTEWPSKQRCQAIGCPFHAHHYENALVRMVDCMPSHAVEQSCSQSRPLANWMRLISKRPTMFCVRSLRWRSKPHQEYRRNTNDIFMTFQCLFFAPRQLSLVPRLVMFNSALRSYEIKLKITTKITKTWRCQKSEKNSLWFRWIKYISISYNCIILGQSLDLGMEEKWCDR